MPDKVEQVTAIVGGSVFDTPTGMFVEGRVVVVQGDRILDVRKSSDAEIPAEAEVISAEGAFVMPGLIDAHNHLYLEPGSFQQQSLQSELDLFVRATRNAAKQLRDGVTTLRDCGTPKFVDLKLKQAIVDGVIPGPRLICAGQWITSSHGHGAFPGAALIADGIDETRRAVRADLREGVDFVKIMVSGGSATSWTSLARSYLSAPELRVVVDEAHSQGKMVAAHIHGGPGVRDAVQAGIDTLEHGSAITDDADIDLIASHQVAWMFNQGARIAEPNPLLPKFEQETLLQSREASILAFQKAHDAGIKIMVGADGYHDDHSLVWALEALVKSGATPLEAIIAATKTPAEVLGVETGVLAPGMLADFVLVNQNPLDSISALRDVRLVIKGGVRGPAG